MQRSRILGRVVRNWVKMADLGEGLTPTPPLIFRPNWGPKGRIKFFRRPGSLPPYLRVWMTPPPPPPLIWSECLDPPLKISHPGLVRDLNSDMKAQKANSLPIIWWLDALKRKEKIIRESAFDKKKKKSGLKFNSGLALTGVRTTGPWGPFLESPGNVSGPKSNFQMEI